MTQFLSRLLRYGSIQVVKNTGSVRKLHTASLLKGYEGEGKTTATVLNIDYSYGLMIDGCSVLGFQLNNGINVIGPMIIFPKTVLNWNIASSEHMNEDSFALFSVLYPQVDIMVIGLDDKYPHKAPFLENVRTILKNLDVSFEIHTTSQACKMFNFLNADNRSVAAAMVPPKDVLSHKMRNIQKIRAERERDDKWKNE